jgi:hypothetical protein
VADAGEGGVVIPKSVGNTRGNVRRGRNELRQTYLRLERFWNRLAVEIEDAKAYSTVLKATALAGARLAEAIGHVRD